MKKSTKDILIVGFAMFAVFFGSGNLIFPPQIGLLSGDQVIPAILGLSISGILFPMLAVAAVGNVGYGLQDMMKHISPWWFQLYIIISVFVVCFGTIPRCGGVSFEVGVQGIVGELPSAAKIIYLLVFFVISYYFAMNKSSVMDKIGNYLTPVLLITLFAVIILAIIKPIDTLHTGVITTAGASFINGFKTGYNTGDVGTGITVAGIFIATFLEKGYTDKKEYKKMMTGIIVVGFVLLFSIYAGLCYLGAQGTQIYPTDVDTTFLLTDLVSRVGGRVGIVVLGIAVIFACLTTAIGMIATVGDWITEWSKGKIPYRVSSLVLTIVMFLVSSTGVSNVIKISGPLFTLIFPMCVVMMILGLCKKFVPNDGAWKGAVFTAFIMAFFDALNQAAASGIVPFDVSGVMNIINMIPFASQGFAWVIPTIIGFIVGAAYWKIKGKESLPYDV